MNAHFPDGSLAAHDLRGSSLEYPFPAAPNPGEAIQIDAGVYWLRLPLPFALDHINVWALEDEGTWTIVDTGVRSDSCISSWQTAFAGALADRPVGRVICTHMHPDHVGLAGWLAERFNCRLWMSRTEYLNCRMLVADTGRPAPHDALRFYYAAGWDDAAIEQYKRRFGAFGRRVHPLPDGYRRIVDDEEIQIGARRWRVIIGRGHSPEHVCLYCADSKLLLSGDQVLPLITSNVSVHPFEPDADPLAEWLDSLALLKLRVADDVLVLPSHNLPFRGLHTRLDSLERRHERCLDALLEFLSAPKRAVDVFSVLFKKRIDLSMLSLATGESLAHLHCLMRRGRVDSTTDALGVRWYHRR